MHCYFFKINIFKFMRKKKAEESDITQFHAILPNFILTKTPWYI